MRVNRPEESIAFELNPPYGEYNFPCFEIVGDNREEAWKDASALALLCQAESQVRIANALERIATALEGKQP